MRNTTSQTEIDEGDELELCRERCGAKLIKRRTVHECILHRGHFGMVGHHVCNCGLVWSEAELQ